MSSSYRHTVFSAAKERWPLGSLGTGLLGVYVAIIPAVGLAPAGDLLIVVLASLLVIASTHLARAEGRRAYLEAER
ncbi:hypothetical protein [Haloplanus salilacus]|uniref:hypothetical protein n=1 Tax=Haloplanus salilacus TaxID=2949994 RepID=UPI0030CBDF0D